jgi:hypothetical protein
MFLSNDVYIDKLVAHVKGYRSIYDNRTFLQHRRRKDLAENREAWRETLCWLELEELYKEKRVNE